MQTYQFAKGRMFLAEKDPTTGLPGALYWVGNVATLTLTLEVENLTHVESYTGKNLEDVRLPISQKANFTARAENFDVDALAFGLYGKTVTVVGAAITGEALPDDLAAGDEVATKQPKISLLTIKDSAAVTPATLVLDTDYAIGDADTGRIKILNVGSYTQPFMADYTYAARKEVGMFLSPPPIRWLRYEGINLVTGKKVVFQLYKTQIDPMSELPFISDGNTVAGYDMKGGALLEPMILPTDPLGQFGFISDLA